MYFLSRVNCLLYRNNVLEPEHSFPLDDPFYPFKVFGVLEVFNEALSIFVPFPIIFYYGASGFSSP
jgi:hypothetical protein